ncbi:hypothetical protein LMANV2_60123 [Leptospira interrogans serovar Manilae]|uniref:Uncharacterized protein n=1 Tax=Leptospira interrogans serovar Manilae TaxID=214675 RepID=A0AAQ1SQ26_LEPIR|nr:hypothetical protein LMANV2_60123 [Leptospira interrogans serovar Manilae]
MVKTLSAIFIGPSKFVFRRKIRTIVQRLKSIVNLSLSDSSLS